MRRTFVRRSEDRRRPDTALRQKRPRKVPTTGLEPVRRFRHWSLKPACLPIPARGRKCFTNPTHNPCSGRDSNPHEVNPHRVLNPARLPIPPPEQDRWVVRPYVRRTSGAEGNRTPDLLNAIQALSQLSYGPSYTTCEISNSVPSGADGT